MLEQSVTQLLIPQLNLWTTPNLEFLPILNRQNTSQQGEMFSPRPVLAGRRAAIDQSTATPGGQAQARLG